MADIQSKEDKDRQRNAGKAGQKNGRYTEQHGQRQTDRQTEKRWEGRKEKWQRHRVTQRRRPNSPSRPSPLLPPPPSPLPFFSNDTAPCPSQLSAVKRDGNQHTESARKGVGVGERGGGGGGGLAKVKIRTTKEENNCSFKTGIRHMLWLYTQVKRHNQRRTILLVNVSKYLCIF